MDDTAYFKTKKDACIFGLIMMNGSAQLEFLKMRKVLLYFDATKAKNWYMELNSVLNDANIPTNFTDEEVEHAKEELNRLYKNMIGQ